VPLVPRGLVGPQSFCVSLQCLAIHLSVLISSYSASNPSFGTKGGPRGISHWGGGGGVVPGSGPMVASCKGIIECVLMILIFRVRR
jgi:hypothetical protein